MNKITFCPHIIMDVPENTIEDIDDYIASYFLDFISAVNEERLTIYFSNILIGRFEEHYPWEKSTDEEWGGYVKQWYGLIMSKMAKVELIEHDVMECDNKHNCSSISQSTREVFNSFLEDIASHTLPGRCNVEAIYSPVDSCNAHDDFITICDYKDLKPAEFPWYKYYPRELPCEGEYPFIPPEDWITSTQPKKGTGHGFLDINGREWGRDTLHKNHWDVQEVRRGAGRYRNVNDEGKIL